MGALYLSDRPTRCNPELPVLFTPWLVATAPGSPGVTGTFTYAGRRRHAGPPVGGPIISSGTIPLRAHFSDQKIL